MTDKRKAFFDALWGPGGHFIAEMDVGGRRSNMDYRKKQAGERVQKWLKNVEHTHEMEAMSPAPSKRDYREGDRNMPTDAPALGNFQKGSLGRAIDYLGDIPFKARYGMGAQEKGDATALGQAPGYEDPQAPGADWTGAQRAMSGYLGGQRWGEGLPNDFQDIRNAVKFYRALMTGEQPIGYSEPGEEAPGIDLRLHDIQRRSTKQGAGGG